MLYDMKRWGKETKSKPETKTARPKWQMVLLRAADELETNGWCQGDFAQGKSHCALGAIRKVGGRRGYAKARYEAEAYLGEALGYWNDDPGRTKEEVVAKLREVAAG